MREFFFLLLSLWPKSQINNEPLGTRTLTTKEVLSLHRRLGGRCCADVLEVELAQANMLCGIEIRGEVL